MPGSKHKSNEWEFQGQVVTWLNAEIKARAGLGLDKATQETSRLTAKRNDLVVWWNRNSESAFVTIELKTPDTSITDPDFFNDAAEKSRRWGSAFFVVWNMQYAELYPTPPSLTNPSPADRLFAWDMDRLVLNVDDWLKPKCATSLQKRTVEILDTAWQFYQDKKQTSIIIDASLFVERLANRLSQLREEILPELRKKVAGSRALRKQIRALSAIQGFIGIVEDLELAVVGQYVYRIVGQILFYFALQRVQPSLPTIEISPLDELPESLRRYWNDVRRFDYEALFEPSELDEIVPLPSPAQKLLRKLIEDLSQYDWNSLADDVLGSVFEHLIPKEEQLLYGQFYTPSKVADMLVAFSVDGSSSVLDPGCGSGTFLMRSYDFLAKTASLTHQEILSRTWGFDISSFATELASINLFRQELSVFENFPRVVRGNFFQLMPGQSIMFPPPKTGALTKIPMAIPKFKAIVGNPPYLRSQNQDDLDPKYKNMLFQAASRAGITAASKTDLFAFFIYRCLEFMESGSRLGFVVSSSWLSSDFGVSIQHLLFERLKLIALVGSSVESFFSQVQVNTVLFIVEKREKSGIAKDELLRFVALRKPLTELLPDGSDYWSQVTRLIDDIEEARDSTETDNYRLTAVSAERERKLLHARPKETRNWSPYLRAPLSYFRLFGGADEPVLV